MNEARPDPDQLLATVKADEARARRGKLRIFFGSTAGVGKTYSMLEAARNVRAGGIDLVVGYVEPHGRVETERLLDGLEQLPTLAVQYRGTVRREFDLDAASRAGRRSWWSTSSLIPISARAIRRRAMPSAGRTSKSCSKQGITVWTTVNVQHLESLNDLVAQITGVRQRETIPDRIFDEADEVELIDLPPDDLIARLQGGQGLRARAGRAPRSTASSASPTCWRCASWRCAESRIVSTPRHAPP